MKFLKWLGCLNERMTLGDKITLEEFALYMLKSFVMELWNLWRIKKMVLVKFATLIPVALRCVYSQTTFVYCPYELILECIKG